MNMKKQTLYMTTSLLTVLGLGACGDFKSKMVGYKDHNQDRNQIPDRAGSEAEAVSQRKWQKLAAALGYDVTPVTTKEELTQYLSTPSKHVKGQNDAYKTMMKELKTDLKANRGKMRCGDIESFVPLKRKNGTEVTLHESDVFQLTYVDQFPTEPGKDPKKRTALVTIPQVGKAKGPLPLLLHLVGGDAGLAPFTKEDSDFTPGMLHNHVVIAPDYGMGICAGEANHDAKKCDKDGYLVAERTKVDEESGDIVSDLDTPWEEDVYSALAAHHCVAQALDVNGRNKVQFTAGEKAIFDAVINRTEGQGVQQMKGNGKLGNIGSASFQAPMSKIFGSSRGGLAAFIAAAWAGVEWEIYFGVFQQFKAEKKIDSLMDLPPQEAKIALGELRKAFQAEFGDNYNKSTLMYPPMFSELINNGGPFSLTIGEFRMLVRDVVLQTHNPLRDGLPGVNQLLPIFEAYANKPEEEDAKELNAVVQTIVRRDMHFLARFLYMSIVKWEDLLEAEFKPQHVGPGKVLLIHGKDDRMVPYTQAKIAFGNLQGLALKQESVGNDLKTLGARLQVGETLATKELELFNSPEMRLFSVLPGMEVSLASVVANPGAGTPRDLHHNDALFWHKSTVAWDLDPKVVDLKAQKIQLGKHPAAFLSLKDKSLSPTEFIDQWMAVEVSK
jgi:hypothetical protein